jgi:hypothetical protein
MKRDTEECFIQMRHNGDSRCGAGRASGSSNECMNPALGCVATGLSKIVNSATSKEGATKLY